MLICSQVHLLGNLHGWNGDKINSEGFYIEQIYLSKEPLELAGFFSNHKRLRDDRYGGGKSGGFKDFQGSQGVENGFHHAW